MDDENLGNAVLIKYDIKVKKEIKNEEETLANDCIITALDVCRKVLSLKDCDPVLDEVILQQMNNTPLLNMIDSLQLLTLHNWLEKATETSLKPDFLFNHPTPMRIQNFFRKSSTVPPVPTTSASIEKEPIAIVGVACKFPGDVDSLADMWEAMVNKKTFASKAPFSRWNLDAIEKKGMTVHDVEKLSSLQYGCFLSEVDSFDPSFFGISAAEAADMDPNHKLILEITTKALYDSGHTKSSLDGSSTGVFIGMSNSDYHDVPGAGFKDCKSVYGATGSALSVAAGRVSFLLGLRGPSFVVDAACASSLVALNQACTALQLNQCESAVVTSINLMLAPWISIAYARAGMLSPDGQCHTFDESANGYCRGEGCGAVVLKRLSEAQQCGDRIYAIVRGSGIVFMY